MILNTSRFIFAAIISFVCVYSYAKPVVIKHHNSTIRSVELALPARTANNQFNVKDFGAKGDGRTLDRKAIQDTIDHAEKKGGGFVVVPEGKYLIGGLILKSNVYLELQKYAELVASDNPEHFKVWNGQPRQK